MSLTRRQFLHALGITAALPLIEPLATLALPFGDESPSLLARMFQTHHGLLQDSVYPILEVGELWYRLPSGLIDKTLAQPILTRDYRPPTSTAADPALQIGEWAQVAAPSAWLYQHPRVNEQGHSVEHGAVGRIVDWLPPANPGDVAWIAVSRHDDERLDWSQAHLWRRLDLPSLSMDGTRYAVVAPDTMTVTAYQGNRAAFSMTYAAGNAPLERGVVYHVQGHYPAMNRFPYMLRLGADARPFIVGVYHHNRFGDPTPVFDPAALQLPVYAARALYEFLPDDAEIRVM